MKRARAEKGKKAEMRRAGPLTGRDGAIDYALRMGEPDRTEDAMDDHIYRVIEIVGTSTESIEDAIHSAIGRAHRTLRNLRWFEVVRTSGHVADGKVEHFQVTLKVGFTMEDAR
jgi:hypothetical protein